MKSKLYFMELGHVLEHAGFTTFEAGGQALIDVEKYDLMV